MSTRRRIGLLAAAVLLAACSASPAVLTPPRPAPAITFQGSTAASATEPSSSLAIERPGEVGADTVLVAHVTARHPPGTTVAPPDGWTEIGVTRSADQLTSWVFLRVAGTSEPEAYEFSATEASTMVGSLSGFGSVDTADPLDTFAGSVSDGSVVLAGPTISTNLGNTVAVWMGSQLSDTNACPRPALAPPTGFRSAAAHCGPATRGLATEVAVRQLGAAADQPRWSGRSAARGAGIVQVVALRPISTELGQRTVAQAQVADRYSAEPAPSLDEPGKVGSLLWDGRRAGKDKDVEIGADVLYQPSGVAASRQDPQILFVNSEKDRGTMVAISARDAQILGRYTVAIPDLFDWEDVAAGPCPTGDCLFAADTGRARDIAKAGKQFSVTRFPEPDVSAGEIAGRLTGDTFPFRYPDGLTPDAEALLVHPWTSDILVITKSGDGVSEVYQFPKPLPEPGVLSELSKVATLRLPTEADDPEAAKVTSAAFHPVANRFLVRTYRHVYEFRGPDGGDIIDALSGTRVELTDPTEGQGEAITYAIDGSSYYTVSEAAQPPYRLNRVDRGPVVDG